MPQSLTSKLVEKTNGATEASRERSAEQLFNEFESVALVVEGSDLGTSEDRFEPTASGINDTEKRPLVTRSGLSIPRCRVCHLHHKWAMNSPTAVGEFFGTVLQQVCHLKFFVIAGDANAAAYKYYQKKTRIPRSVRFFSCRYAKRDETRGQYGTPI